MLAVGAAVGGGIGEGTAAAQGVTCKSGLGAAVVDISSPFQGESVSGVVAVKGRATALLGLNRAELRINGSLISTIPLDNQIDVPLSFSWDSSQSPPGLTSVRVVVCGAGNQLGPYGETTVSVDVRRSSSTTSPSTSVPDGTVPGGTTPTTLARPTTTATGATTTTVARATTSTTQAAPPETVPERTPASIAIDSQPRALVVRDGTNNGSGKLPIWVGAVVGLSGLGGLGASLAVRRRPTLPDLPAEPMPAEHLPEAIEPVLTRD